MHFQARHCQNPSCGLRFPVDATSNLGDSCPFCKTETRAIDEAYETHAARASLPREMPSGPALYALVDNVRSLNNVGAIFRSADGVGLRQLFLTGFTPTPEHPKLGKTALGAEQSVRWSSHADAPALAKSLVEQGYRLWALEGGPRSQPFFDLLAQAGDPSASPLVLVVGHEVSGVDPHVLEHCECVARLPMHGQKGSLNVAVAFGIAAYALAYAGHLAITAP